MLRIVTVYDRNPKQEDVERGDLSPLTMAYIRWFKISENLARLGHQVDVAVTDVASKWPRTIERFGQRNLNCVALSDVDWSRYDVVKTLFHSGFNTLAAHGGADHPFIISKLGSVVGPRDMDGIYFYGEMRKQLFATQQKIHRASRYVTVLTQQAKSLWQECFGETDNVLVVPGGVDETIPPANGDPYPADGYEHRILFAGNVYNKDRQPEANRVLVDKLNRLGRELTRRGARLYMLGVGDVSALDRKHVTYLGSVEYDRSWDYFHHADVGVVVAAGSFNHNNESTKIYHYLRAGVPVVSESGFPNDDVVTSSGLGFLVGDQDMELLAAKAVEAATRDWDRERAVRYVLDNHTWEKRVATYGGLFERHFRD